jgi:hypothetical protein
MIIKVVHKINKYSFQKIEEWVLIYNHNFKILGKNIPYETIESLLFV